MRDKQVLLARRKRDGKRVVIKWSDSDGGRNEIRNEKRAQDTLSQAIFSQTQILFPAEIAYEDTPSHTFRITEFIEQEKVFGAYSVPEQFFMIMKEFETEEAFYANTFEHIKITKNVFPITHADDYIRAFSNFEIGPNKDVAIELLKNNRDLIETRSNYLTHTDFAPSNFRVSQGKMYMIDLSSMHFANRYEGLARFLNWCLIQAPELGEKISEYIKANRETEEYLCLRLMRVYKAGLLLDHYNKKLPKTTGDLERLTMLRIHLWEHILDCLIKDAPVPEPLIEDYKQARDRLRSEEELKRQKEFNLI